MKNILRTLFLLLFCSGIFTFAIAQDLRTILPKNKQSVAHEVNLLWSNLNREVDKFQVQVFQGTSLVLDTSMYHNSFALTLAQGEYTWKVFALKNQHKIDSTYSTFRVYTPYEIDSLNLWLAADTNFIVFINDTMFYQWLDQSSKSNHSIEAHNALVRSSYFDDGLNGYGKVQFINPNSSFCRLDLSNALLSNQYSIYMVYNYYGTSTKRRIIGDLNNLNWWMGFETNQYNLYDANNLKVNQSVIRNNYIIQQAHSYKDSLYHFINGQLYGVKEAENAPGGDLRIGIDRPDADFLEIIMINDSISWEEKAKIDQYLMDKYAPPVNLGPDRWVCSFPDSIHTSMDYAHQYTWSTGDTTPSIQVDSAGWYYLSIIDEFERETKDSIYIGLDTLNYIVNLPYQEKSICLGDTVELGLVAFDNLKYSWSTLDSTPFIQISAAGQYILTVENCFNQSFSDTLRISTQQPQFSLGADTLACFNEVLTLTPDSNFTQVIYNWSNGQTSPSILADSTQYYALRVTDTLGCFYEDSIFVEIDSSLYGLSLGNDTSLCLGNVIGLNHNPDTIIDYVWNTSERTPTIAVNQAGVYHLSVSNGRCVVSDTIQIAVHGEAPQLAFTSQNLCFLDTVEFTNTSQAPTGDSIVSWIWDFGDGDSSFQPSPQHLYDSVDNYLVTLYAETDKGCGDTLQRKVQILHLPKSEFRTIGYCENEEVRFLNQSTSESGNIIGHLWNFGDPASQDNSSNRRNPFHAYDTLGTYTVSLITTTNFGCKDTLNKNISIEATPHIDYAIQGLCFGDSTGFLNQTVIAKGGIKEYLWEVNNQRITSEHAKVLFLDPGKHEFSLRVISDSLCISKIKEEVEIFEPPLADFEPKVFCQGEAIAVEDVSNVDYPIIEWEYLFDGTEISNQTNPVFNRNKPNFYAMSMAIKDIHQCVDTLRTAVRINPKPEADFTILGNGSGVPYRLELENNSKLAEHYSWSLGNGADSSKAEIPSFIFTQKGDYLLNLITTSKEGCKDTLEKTLRLLPYFLDANLQRFILQEKDGQMKIQLVIENTGNNKIENLEVATNVNNGVSFIETLEPGIFKAQSQGFELNSSIQLDKDMNFVCVRIVSVNDTLDDVLFNNRDCQPIKSQKDLFLNLYPNPTLDNINMEYILPVDGDISLKLYDQMGRLVYQTEQNQQEEGYYRAVLPTRNLRAGIYHYVFQYYDQKQTGTIVKQ